MLMGFGGWVFKPGFDSLIIYPSWAGAKSWAPNPEALYNGCTIQLSDLSFQTSWHVRKTNLFVMCISVTNKSRQYNSLYNCGILPCLCLFPSIYPLFIITAFNNDVKFFKCHPHFLKTEEKKNTFNEEYC